MVRIEWWRCAGKGDTETRVITVPVSGAGGGSAPREACQSIRGVKAGGLWV
jgi:hypothetical protein